LVPFQGYKGGKGRRGELQLEHHAFATARAVSTGRAAARRQAVAHADHIYSTQVFSYVGKWSVEEPTVYPGIDGDEGLVLKTKAAHHAISAPFEAPLDPKGKTIVAQYEVKLQKGLECGGAYIKLLTDSDVVSCGPSVAGVELG
jgi:hypothetical protein